VSTLMAIHVIQCLPTRERYRRSSPDGDLSDPLGTAPLRPIFLGQSTGIRPKQQFLSRNNGNRMRTSLEPEFEAPEDQFDSTPESQSPKAQQIWHMSGAPESVDTEDEELGLPDRAIKERIHRERQRTDRLRDQHLIHPDSDALRGRHNQFTVDDPLPEMIAGADMAANPYADKTSLSSIVQQLLLESIGL
jgi:hypothetical protein